MSNSATNGILDPRLPGRALAQHKLGNTGEAMKSLTAAEKLLDSGPAWFWSDKLERQFLRGEVVKRICGR